jgi:predicted component of type VI protein secretion system
MLKLRIVAGPDAGKEYRLNEGETVVGRGGSSNIVLPEPQVSTRHAQITVRDNEVQIADLSSTNGTIVNGRRITEKVPLSVGDRLRLGPYEAELIEVTVSGRRTQLMGSAGRRCPACGTVNPASAVRCVHCTADLETGEKPPAGPKVEKPVQPATAAPTQAPTTVTPAKPMPAPEEKRGFFCWLRAFLSRLFGRK